MADDEKWGLSREEINKRVRELNQKKKAQGPTRGGRSSGQGVKLLYIRDFLYAHATKEHPKTAKDIQKFLATNAVEASTKTIYNDIVRLHDDFGVPVVYDAKRWGYYITEPEFKPYELRLMVDSIQSSKIHLRTSSFFSSFRSSSSVYVWMGALSAFGSCISKCGRYWHFIKNRINVFKSRA